MFIKKIFYIFSLIVLLHSCQGFKQSVMGTTKKKGGDEFLVIKKEPLTLPPKFGELPVPTDEEASVIEIKNIEDIIKSNKENNKVYNSSSSENLETSILKKIK